MGKKEKLKAMAREHEQIDEINDNLDGASTPSLVFSSDDDDDEANQDLSLRIVEKSLRAREANLAPNEAILNGIGSSLVSPSQQSEFKVMKSNGILDRSIGIAAWEVMEQKKTTKLMVESRDSSVIIDANQEVEEIIKTTENHESADLELCCRLLQDNNITRAIPSEIRRERS